MTFFESVVSCQTIRKDFWILLTNLSKNLTEMDDLARNEQINGSENFHSIDLSHRLT